MNDPVQTQNSSAKTIEVNIRRIVPADAPEASRIIYEAFKGIAERHNFPPDFPVPEAAIPLTGLFINHPQIFGVAAELSGRFIGSNFLDERGPIRGIGPITVDPSCQSKGIGRKLMEAVIERGKNANGIRLVQDAFNTTSYSLYTSLGFDTKEPLMLMQGRPQSSPSSKTIVRPMQETDLEACEELCQNVHGFSRKIETRDTMKMFKAFVLLKGESLRAYTTSVNFWPLNHAVAETTQDLQELLLGAAAAIPDQFSFILPTRASGFFRWSLKEGFRSVKPMTLMSTGRYQEPKGAFTPSVMF